MFTGYPNGPTAEWPCTSTIRSSASPPLPKPQLHDVDHQLVFPIEPLQQAAGDRIGIDLHVPERYRRAVHWGDGARSEMCFARNAMYPLSAGDRRSLLGVAPFVDDVVKAVERTTRARPSRSNAGSALRRAL